MGSVAAYFRFLQGRESIVGDAALVESLLVEGTSTSFCLVLSRFCFRAREAGSLMFEDGLLCWLCFLVYWEGRVSIHYAI